MRWPFSTPKSKMESRAKNALRDLMVLESQQKLLEAATATADAANFVTHALKTKLQDSMAQFENTARILNDALVICDLTGAIQAFNPAAERMFGISADEARTKGVSDLLVSPQTPDAWSLLASLPDEQEPVLFGRYSDRSQFALDVNHTRLDRQDGTSIVLLVMREKGSTSEEIKANLKSYRSIFESSFDGIIVAKDQSVLAANYAASNLFGYGVEELLTKPLDTLIMPGREMPINDEVTDLQVKGKHQDGHLMGMAFTTSTIWWNGEAASLVTIKDVTPVDAEVFSPNMICCFGGNYKISFVNAAFAAFYGEKREALIGSDIRSLLPPEECDPFLIQINSLSNREPTRKMQLRSKGPDGAPRLQVWTDHVTYEDGAVEYQRVGQTVTPKDAA